MLVEVLERLFKATDLSWPLRFHPEAWEMRENALEPPLCVQYHPSIPVRRAEDCDYDWQNDMGALADSDIR